MRVTVPIRVQLVALVAAVADGGEALRILEADRRAAFAAGFDLHLTKPVPFSELREALDSSR